MNKLKPLLLIGLLLFLLPSLHAQGVQVGPWISDTGENSLTILWTSEAPESQSVFSARDWLRMKSRVQVDRKRGASRLPMKVLGESVSR